MSDAEYKAFRKKQDKVMIDIYKAMPVEELMQLVDEQSAFVEGQLEWGGYDEDDMFGPAGHARTLELQKQALREVMQSRPVT
tara:strand:+ start:45 stop:290 length:246 start_codon:yes stop_codon:yes gene_type:complete